MGGKATLVLLALVGALVAVLYFTDRKPPAKESNEVSALDGHSLTDAVGMRWQFEGRPAVELSRGDDGLFRVSEPIVDRASPGYLQQIVAAWDSAQLRRTPLADDEDGRRKAGLIPPALTFRATWPGGVEVNLEVGAPGPLGNGRFMRRDGVIWEGGEGLLTSLEVGLDDLRDRSVFRNEAQTCRELEVTQKLPTGKAETIKLVRKGLAWRLEQPVAGRADADVATSFVTAVLALRVGDFIHGMIRLPEREPEIVIAARGGLGDERIQLWLQEGQVFGVLPDRGGIAFTSDNRQYTQIFVNATERIRARILVPLRNVAEDLGEIVVDASGGQGDRLRLTRASSAEEWRLAEPIEFATHPTPVNELVQAINNLHAREFVDGKDSSDPAFGLGQGRLVVDVRGFRGEKATLWLGNEVHRGEDSFVYACRADEPGTVVLVPAPPVDQLRRPFTEYCNRDVVRIGAVVERLELQSRAGQVLVFKNDGDNWVKEGDVEPRNELGGFVNDVLRDLRAQRVVDLRDGRFGDPDWLLSLRRANGDSFVELRVWDRSKAAPLVVQPKGGKAVGFELSDFVAKSLRELWQ
ncbi:MAG: DUF4340 domain-containing protein [Planctomycetes bacterium]|nr:DUF4340 domain-containing protein [Planctomycetota bacterium]